MRVLPPVPHYLFVDSSSIKPQFFQNEGEEARHRATLRIPFKNRKSEPRTLCVIGQNPSDANETVADKTIAYIEELIYRKYEEYTELLILNLYSRVDTRKGKTDPLHIECDLILQQEIYKHTDFLIIFGKLKNQGSYKFKDRAKSLMPFFHSKNIYKIDIETTYAPHPGNSQILYRNFDVDINRCDFLTLVSD